MKSKTWILIFAGFLLVAAVAILVLPRLRPHRFHGTLLQSPETAPDFTLTDHFGQKASLSDFRGKTVLLYFGYTFCPDVCPTTLSELADVLEILGEDKAERIQVLMVSVDPERDTPEKMRQYLNHFGPRFLGLTGSLEEIASVAALYGIYFERHEGTAATGYLIDHTASVMVINEQGHLKLVFPFGTSAEDIADDLAYLLR